MVERKRPDKSHFRDGFDTTKAVLYYENDLLVREESFHYYARSKPGLIGCVRKYPEDFLPAQWYPNCPKYYFYDEKQRLIEEITPDKENPIQNRYLYEYDEEGRLKKKQSLANERLNWTETYTYLAGHITMTREWYSEEKMESWSPPRSWRFERFLDENGNLIREEIYYNKLERENVFCGFDTYEYDKQGRLVKFMGYGKEKDLQIKHEYLYK